ncbi:hypothetical protein QJQ45_009937 [Haematococcus lacustris]|nr:hypothetical protein QJQ45_009937 [Haematococcus lacustris]
MRLSSGSSKLPTAFISGANDADWQPLLAMGRRGQRSKKGSAIMAARVAACLAPWTRMAGFIANRLKELEVELQASQTQLGSDVAASQQREQRMQAQIEKLQRHNVRHRLAAAEEMAGLQRFGALRTLGLHILPGQQLEDRVPCGMTLGPAMDDICHQAYKHQSGLCAQAGAGAIGFDSKGDNLGIIMHLALPMGHPAPTNSLSPTPANPPSPTINPCQTRQGGQASVSFRN